MIGYNRISIPSDANQLLFRNMEDRSQGSYNSISAIMAKISCLVVGVVCDQSVIPA